MINIKSEVVVKIWDIFPQTAYTSNFLVASSFLSVQKLNIFTQNILTFSTFTAISLTIELAISFRISHHVL